MARIDYPTFVELLDADSAGKAIKVNIFDAIKRIYGLSLVDLAVILNVSFGVMYRARSVGTPAKRLKNFSQTLCIPAEFFSEITTHDFPKIEQCKIEFEKQTDVNTALKVCPEWKTELARQVANTIRCPIHIAKEIARVDNLNWQKGMGKHPRPVLNASHSERNSRFSTLITTLEFGYRKRAAVLKTVARKGDIYKLFATRPP